MSIFNDSPEVENIATDICAGDILNEEFLIPLGIEVNELAKALKVSEENINGLIDKQHGMTAELALKLSKYFGTSARFWMNLQVSYDLAIAENKLRSEIDLIKKRK